MINTWVSILSMADMYDMDKVKAVALHALGRETALGDVRRVAICLCYGVDRSWAQDAFTSIIIRGEFLTDEEVDELIACPRMIGEIGRAQLELLRAAVPRHIPVRAVLLMPCWIAQRLVSSKRQRTRWREPCEIITWTSGHLLREIASKKNSPLIPLLKIPCNLSCTRPTVYLLSNTW